MPSRRPRGSCRALRPAAALDALVALVATAACFKPVPVDGAAAAEPQPGRVAQNISGAGATLIVENMRPIDYRIFISPNSYSAMSGTRVGLASGTSTTRFTLRADLLPAGGQVRLVGRAVGGGRREDVGATGVIPYGRTARLRILPNDTYIQVDPLPEPKDTTERTPPDSTKPPRR